ncbi:helix-turn-helix transcriptional regulator [Cohnella caldifontis]|uniref:helix-turn-helix transcriptional regulator n=1 Tax=Cohnella caldifontis TaxID=3027471 RepID=UPI0023ED80CF|nr:AraC family transcriptional regulator [Cohnella sp. YIM B05605]
MEMSTIGTRFYPQFRLDMVYAGRGNMEEVGGYGNRYRLLLIQSGAGVVRVNDRRFPLQPQAVYCFREREDVELLDGTGISALSLYFHPNVINRKLTFDRSGGGDLSLTDGQDQWCLKPFDERTEAYYGCIPLDPALSRHAERILEDIGFNLQHQPDNSWPCRSRSLLLELLFLVGRAYQRGETGPQGIPDAAADGMEDVLLYLHVHYGSKLKLEDIARKFNTNKTTLNQKFKAYTGYSIVAYLNGFRMQMASSMLRNTTLSRDEIASRVGFKDSAHFNRSFSKHIGYSPSAYRSEFCWMLK